MCELKTSCTAGAEMSDDLPRYERRHFDQRDDILDLLRAVVDGEIVLIVDDNDSGVNLVGYVSYSYADELLAALNAKR